MDSENSLQGIDTTYFDLSVIGPEGFHSTVSAWDESARWWTFIATLANFASIYLLVRVFNTEGKCYMDGLPG